MAEARKIRIVAGTVTMEAELNASETATLIWNALPIEAAGQTWGDEIYFGIPVRAREEKDAQAVVEMGAIAFWPPGNAFCIFFGPTPASRSKNEIRPVQPGERRGQGARRRHQVQAGALGRHDSPGARGRRGLIGCRRGGAGRRWPLTVAAAPADTPNRRMRGGPRDARRHLGTRPICNTDSELRLRPVHARTARARMRKGVADPATVRSARRTPATTAGTTVHH